MPATAAVFLITMFTGFFACLFGIYYLKTRQNLAMIEKGMNPKVKVNTPAPFGSLKWGLVAIGCGTGLLLAYLIDQFAVRGYSANHHDDNTPAIYFSLIAIGGGVGLVISYMIEKKHWLDKQGNGGAKD